MGRTSRKRCRKRRLDIKKIAENEEDSPTRLKSWLLTKNCSSVRNLAPFNFPITGRGLKALKNIEANDIIIKLPYEILITTSALSRSSISILFSKTERYTAQSLLAVFILYELHLADVSKWCYYINSLPKALTNPDFCTRREKNLLPKFAVDYMRESCKVRNDFRSLAKSISNLNLIGKDHCPHCNLPLSKIITFEKYKWAYYVVNTRAVYIDAVHVGKDRDNFINVKDPNNLALAPFLDLFNHDICSATKASVVADENGRKFYQLVTLNSFDSGSQVFINYGAHSSLKLYVHYGFFIPNNPLDEISFNIADIEACFEVPKFKLDFIVFNNLHKNMAFTREGLNYNALSALFVVHTSSQKDCWNLKIYGNSLTPEDTANAHGVAKKILGFKKDQLLNQLKDMKSLKERYTESFSIAIALVEEYVKILSESRDNFCRSF